MAGFREMDKSDEDLDEMYMQNDILDLVEPNQDIEFVGVQGKPATNESTTDMGNHSEFQLL